MAVQIGHHYVQKFYVSVLSDFVTGDQMPAAVPVVAFAAFAGFDGGFDFKSRVRLRINEVGVSLVRIALETCVLVEALGEQVGDKS